MKRRKRMMQQKVKTGEKEKSLTRKKNLSCVNRGKGIKRKRKSQKKVRRKSI